MTHLYKNWEKVNWENVELKCYRFLHLLHLFEIIWSSKEAEVTVEKQLAKDVEIAVTLDILNDASFTSL